MLEEVRRDRQTLRQGDSQPNRGKQAGKRNEAKVKEGRQREVGN
jgi:hypothetical protein